MSQARGFKERLLFIFESEYNQPPTVTPGDSTILPFNKHGLASSQKHVTPETIRGLRSQLQPALGNITVEGQVEAPLDAQGIGFWLKLFSGAPETTGAGPYTHTFKLKDDLPSATIEAGFASPAHYMKYTGCKAESLSLSFGGDGELVANISIIGAKEVSNTSSMDLAPSNLADFLRFNNFQAAIKEGGSTIGNITQLDLEIKNNLERNYTIGAAGCISALPEGLVEITGKLTAIFSSTTLLTKALNGTESSIEVTLTSGANILAIKLPEVVYERAPLGRNGPAGVMVELPFRAYYEDNSDESPYVIALTNGVASY